MAAVLLTAGISACGPQTSASPEGDAAPPVAQTTAPRAAEAIQATAAPATEAAAIRVDVPQGTEAEARPATEVEADRVTVPQGTEVYVTLSTPIGSETSRVGDELSATTLAPVVVGDRVVIPVGSIISGSVTEVDTGEKGLKVSEKGGSVVLAFDTVTTPDGRSTPIYATISSIARSKGKTEKIIGGSAAGGALLGKILGGSTKDAVIGAVIGGGIGTAVVAGTEGKQLLIPAGTELTMILDQPVFIAANQ